MSSLADETPEGRSIVELAVHDFGLTIIDDPGAVLVPFTAQTRMSGMDLSDGATGPQGCGRLRSPFRRGRGWLVPAGGAADRRAGVE